MVWKKICKNCFIETDYLKICSFLKFTVCKELLTKEEINANRPEGEGSFKAFLFFPTVECIKLHNLYGISELRCG